MTKLLVSVKILPVAAAVVKVKVYLVPLKKPIGILLGELASYLIMIEFHAKLVPKVLFGKFQAVTAVAPDHLCPKIKHFDVFE
jgi:hypothetical protein